MNPAVMIFLKRWWPAIAGTAVLLAVLTLTYCSGKSAGKSGEVVKQQKREIQTQQDLGRANEKAGDRRMEDAARSTAQQKELEDALAASKDPDRQRILRGCVILRQQGQKLPATCK